MADLLIGSVTLTQPAVVFVRPVIPRRVVAVVVLPRLSVPVGSVAATVADLDVVVVVVLDPSQNLINLADGYFIRCLV
jgi:hypothetical protein